MAERLRNISKQDVKRFCGENAAFIAFIALVITAIILRGDVFLTPTNIINVLRHNAVVGIIALGMTLVIVLGEIDLAVGAKLVLIGWIILEVFNATQNIFLTIVVGLIVGAITGSLQGVLVAKLAMPSFIVTLGMMTIYRSIAQYALRGGGLMVGGESYASYLHISRGDIFGIPLPIYYWIILSFLMFLFTSHTAVGRHMYAIGSNKKAAMLSGINVDRIKILAFAMCGVMVALAAVAETSRIGAINSASSGLTHNMDAIAAVVIGGASLGGGRGRIIGTFFGVMTLGVITNMLNLVGVNPFLFGAARGAIVIAAIFLQKRLDS